MDLVLPAQIDTCPAAPGADLGFAISLLEMSVVGIPLLLALFQYINDHEYPEQETELTFRTFGYGIMMALSAFLLWGFYLTAFCVIIAELGATRLTTMLYLFWWVMVIVILVILSIQLEQMLIERLRVALVAYIFAIGTAVATLTNLFQAGLLVRVVAFSVAAVVGGVGFASQLDLLPAPRDRQEAGTTDDADEEQEERMESLDSVYK